MSYYFTLTERGRELLSRCLDGEDGLVLTRTVFGSGVLGDEQSADGLSELIAYEGEGTLLRRGREGSTLELTAQYTNESYDGVGFTLNEYGIYAKQAGTDEEILFLYATLGEYGQGVPPHVTGQATNVWSFPMVLTISKELTVTIETPAGLVTDTELTEAVDALRLELAAKGGGARIGTAEEIATLSAGELLFLTDDTGAEGYAVTLAELLAEGALAAEGKENSLSGLATAGTANVLNLRASESGARFATDEDFMAKITALCSAVIADGAYLTDGVISLSWRQVQGYLLYGKLLTETEAEGYTWFWCADGADRLAALEEEVRSLRALIGDLNKVLDTINDTEGAS